MPKRQQTDWSQYEVKKRKLNGNSYDYSKDQAFLSASPEDQDAYLKANDPNYAKATAQKQQRYLQYLRGAKNHDAGVLAAPLHEFVPENLAGFVLFDETNRYEINFPKGW